MADKEAESGEAVLWGSLVAASFLSSYTLLEHSFLSFFLSLPTKPPVSHFHSPATAKPKSSCTEGDEQWGAFQFAVSDLSTTLCRPPVCAGLRQAQIFNSARVTTVQQIQS